MSPGQAVIGQDPNNLTFTTGQFQMADGTALINLFLGIGNSGGSVLCQDGSGLLFQNVQAGDEGALASCIVLTDCSQITLTDVDFGEIPRNGVEIVDASGQITMTRVTVDGLGGGLVINSSKAGVLDIDLNNLTCTNTSQPLQLSYQNVVGSLNSRNCEMGAGVSEALSVDLSGDSGVQAKLQGWKIPVLTANSRLLDWTTSDNSDCTLRIEGWDIGYPGIVDGNGNPQRPALANSFNFTSQDQSLAQIVFSKNDFWYSNPIHLLAEGSSKMYVRHQDYARCFGQEFNPNQPEDYVPFHMSGKDSARVFARLVGNGDPCSSSAMIGIIPVFDFQDSSLATIVRLFGQTESWGSYVTNWYIDNPLSATLVLNGLQKYGEDLQVTSLPNYASAPKDDIGIPTP